MPINGFNQDKCQQRNHLAARRDGVNAAPMRFLKRAEMEKFLAQSPHNRGGAGKLPASDAEALSIINAKLAKPLTLEQIHIHYIEAANTNFVGDRYLFLDPSTLKNIATDAQAGFAFMNSHRTGGLSHQSELPFGRTFCGRFENYTDEPEGDAQPGETRQRTVVGFYMLAGVKPNGDSGPSTDDLSAMIDAMTVFDVSVGLYGGDAICDVCGEDLNAYDSVEGWLCPHVPGSTYKMTAEQVEAQKARGVGDGAASYSLCDSHCGEVSAVYDGAVPGAGFRKALSFAKDGGLSEDALVQLQHAYEALLASSAASPFGAKSTVRPGTLVETKSKSPEGKGSLNRNQGADMKLSTNALGAAIAAALAAVGFGAENDESGTPQSSALTGGAGTGADLAQGQATVQPATNLGGGVLQIAPAAVSSVALAPVAPAQPVPAKLSAEDEARFTKQEEELNKLRENLEKANTRAAEKETEARFTANSAYIEGKKRDFFLTPAAADKYLELAKTNPDAFEACKPGIEANAPVVALAGNGGNNGNNGGSGSADATVALGGQAEGTQLETLAKEYQTKNKVSYGEAFSAVCSANPDLAAAYRAAQVPG